MSLTLTLSQYNQHSLVLVCEIMESMPLKSLHVSFTQLELSQLVESSSLQVIVAVTEQSIGNLCASLVTAGVKYRYSAAVNNRARWDFLKNKSIMGNCKIKVKCATVIRIFECLIDHAC